MQRTPLRLALAAALLAAPLLAACGDDDSSSDPPDGSTTTVEGGSGGGSSITVGATDQLKFDATSYEAEAGPVEITYDNQGSVAHTLLIKGVADFKLSIGSEDEGTVDLEPGEYQLYCDIAGHEAAGMVADLTVS